MIARLQGLLELVDDNAVLLRPDGGVTYLVLVPAHTASLLLDSLGQTITLHTLSFIESQNQGSTLFPRLAGFLTLDDKRFFELFITCKGIGNKRALRAMAVSTPQIAAAIADRDLATLQSLPGIKQFAETIIATFSKKNLSSKIDAFITPQPPTPNPAITTNLTGIQSTLSKNSAQPKKTKKSLTFPTPNPQSDIQNPKSSTPPLPNSLAPAIRRQAIDTLVTLGEDRIQAITWIEHVFRESNPPTQVHELLSRVYQLKSTT